MRHGIWTLIALAGLIAPTSLAGIDIDFGANVQIGDDADLFLSVSARYFDEDRGKIDRVAVHYRNSDDVAVALFISRHSGRSSDHVHGLRARGLSWWDISVRLGVPMETWFVPVKRDPGPPYGKAYGHWKKRKHDRHHVAALTDADLRNLVAVRMLHEYYGVSVDVAMQWRSSGNELRRLVADEYTKRHGNKHAAASKGGGHAKPKRGPKRKR